MRIGTLTPAAQKPKEAVQTPKATGYHPSPTRFFNEKRRKTEKSCAKVWKYHTECLLLHRN